MQAIILAAGMGKRLGSLTKNSTKCMLPFNGRRLVEYTLDAIVGTKALKRIVVVVGHGAEEVMSFLGKQYKGLPIEYVHNKVYDKTNNIYSLLLTKDYLTADDTVLFEGDLIFDPAIVSDLINDQSANVAVVAKHESWMDGTVALLDESGHIKDYISKKEFKWAHADNYFKTVNIYKLSKEFSASKFVPFLSAYISANGMNGFYEEVLKLLASIDRSGFKALSVGDKCWYEIDDVQDLDIASVLFAKDEDKVGLMQRRYGGYWRFPRLKDYCYLVNPYFPPVRLVEEMKSSYLSLLVNYPSGQTIQNLLAAKMFGCEAEHILVGNGASEIIKGLMEELQGNVGMSFPTFEEYAATLEKGKLVEFYPSNADFSYTADELLAFCLKQNISTLVLINPDNPSGHFLSKSDVLRVAKELNRQGKLFIVDESFVDFMDGSSKHTLIDDEILTSNPNLIVIKSISKSYGVPGIRLGVMATANRKHIDGVRKKVTIWNINSFGEYFLQIIGKYISDYQSACVSLVQERERLFGQLKTISYLRPIHSYANYILCEVKGGVTSAQLTAHLLNTDLIFIKDCKGKKGIGDQSYVRLAVRDSKDNDQLIASLRKIK